jgi:hypothetical protein
MHGVQVIPHAAAVGDADAGEARLELEHQRPDGGGVRHHPVEQPGKQAAAAG